MLNATAEQLIEATTTRPYTIVGLTLPSPAPAAAAHRRSSRATTVVSGLRGRLAPAFPWLVGDRWVVRLGLAAAGFVPVTLIAASTFGVIGLKPLAVGILAPVVALVLVSAIADRTLFGRLGAALLAGFVATGIYDLDRFSFLGLHLVGHDPIPHIGTALGLHPAWVFGYLWRYLFNGGGLSIAFTSLGYKGVRRGIQFGLFVAAGLIVVLLISPFATVVLFPLTIPSLVMVISGHAIYGGVLGAMGSRRAQRSEALGA